ncbi:hypothetical protein TNCV_4787721 [Trichonephila clavipes]|nr:hypothetical protein TNCV_4787721 [Trichonephila clavipes]
MVQTEICWEQPWLAIYVRKTSRVPVLPYNSLKTTPENCARTAITSSRGLLKSSREVVGRGREVGDPWPLPQVVLPLKWGTEPNPTVTCMVLKATDIIRRHIAHCHDEFSGLNLAFADQAALVTTTTKMFTFLNT